MNGKYGDLLKKARQHEQLTTPSEPQPPCLRQDEVDSLPNAVDSKTVLEQDVNTVKELALFTENSSILETEIEKEVSLTIKVPVSWRQHWVAECKREGKTLKQVVTQMLKEKYGLP